jgi:hypothetical protein
MRISQSEANEMKDAVVQRTARQMRAVFVLATLLGIGIGAHAAPIGASASTMAPNASSHAATPAHKSTSVKRVVVPANPSWAELTPAQQNGLQPLANEWDKLDPFRKNKWLAIGNKFAKMKPEEQQRLHDRMREWAKLTPEQRRVARESYTRAKRLNSDQKSARWQQYQQLPEEQKKKLAADEAARKHGATVLPPTSQGKHRKTLPPIKASPKRILERSVTPQAASQSAIQPSQPPAQQN